MWNRPTGCFVLLGMLVCGCSPAPDSQPADCAVGKRPGYFVPGDGPAVLVGCARLGVSRKRVEFSLNLGRINGEVHLCVNLAFTGRGRPGFYIPSICNLNPPPARLAVRGLVRPRPGIRRYELVIWGTAPPGKTAVEARIGRTAADAAVFKVPAKLSRRYGERPFSVFVVELPLRAEYIHPPLRPRLRAWRSSSPG